MTVSSNAPAVNVLKLTPLFAAMPAQRVLELAKHATRRDYAAGEVLFSESDHPDGVFISAWGNVRLARRTSNGAHVVVGEESAPCALITPGLFDGGSNCVTATAVHDATAYVLPTDVFLMFCRDHPDILFSLLTEVSRRVRQTAEFIDLVTVGSIRQRVARVLLDLADECGNATFNLPRSQAKLALCIGTVREVVFRHLKQLQSEGILRFHGSEIVVDDVARLQTVAGARVGSGHVFGPQATPSIPAYIAPRDRRK